MAKATAFARSNAPIEGKESFAALLEESLQSRDSFEGTVVQGTVVVLVACVIVGAFLYLNDEIWKNVVQKVLLK